MRQVFSGTLVAFWLILSHNSRADEVRYYNSWFCSGAAAYDQQVDLSGMYSGLDLNTNTAIFCPAADYTSSANTIQSADVYYKLNSTAASMACTWYGWDGSGDYYSTSTKYTCSTAGGCNTSGQPENTGYDYIQWTSTSGGGNLVTNSAVAAPFYGLQCNVVAGGSFVIVYGYATVTGN